MKSEPIEQNKEEDTSSSPQLRMIDIVGAELHDLQKLSMQYREGIDTAKSSVKKKYFKKKLKKNNKKMMNMLVAFEKLRGRDVDTSSDAENIPEPKAPELVPED